MSSFGRSRHNVRRANTARCRRYAPDFGEEHAPIPASPAHRPITAEELAADPEFQQWAAEERAAEIAVLTARAHR